MAGTDKVVLVGRSSSHFTRTARMFAIELGVPHTFEPVFDIMSLDPGSFANNPALKVPILVDARGPLFGAENICREFVRVSGAAAKVVMRGDVADRVVANAEELTLHVMASEVALITAKLGGDENRAPPKVRQSLENSLGYLDQSVDAVLAALPVERALSFVEVALFCTATHLPFRELADVSAYTRISEFCARFADRESARLTEYHFDAKPA